MAAEGRGVMSSLFTPSATGLCKWSPYKGEKTSKPDYEWTARSAGGEALANTCPHSHCDHHRGLLSNALKHCPWTRLNHRIDAKVSRLMYLKVVSSQGWLILWFFLSVWSSIKFQILFISQPFCSWRLCQAIYSLYSYSQTCISLWSVRNDATSLVQKLAAVYSCGQDKPAVQRVENLNIPCRFSTFSSRCPQTPKQVINKGEETEARGPQMGRWTT